MRFCPRCKTEKLDTDYYKTGSYCKTCLSEYVKKWQKARYADVKTRIYKWQSDNKERVRRHHRKWKAGYLLNPDNAYKEKLRKKLMYAVRAGKIIRPVACDNCKTLGRVQGHHHKGYSEKTWDIVQWLCPPCHSALHQ